MLAEGEGAATVSLNSQGCQYLGIGWKEECVSSSEGNAERAEDLQYRARVP